jgi:hypothetical protein
VTLITGNPSNSYQEKALKLRGEYNQWLERTRNDRTLSAVGKQQQIARKYLEYKREVAAIQAQQETNDQNRLKTLRRELFGMPGTTDGHAAIAYRDAIDRATRLEKEEDALSMLSLAEMSGDSTLAKAIAARGFQRGWNDLVNTYADQFPTSQTKFQELADLESAGNPSSQGTAQLINTAMIYTIDKPNELSGLQTDRAIEAVATS